MKIWTQYLSKPKFLNRRQMSLIFITLNLVQTINFELANADTSAAASEEILALCTNHTKSYPSQWTWDQNKTMAQPRAATIRDNLTPKIEQVRNGKVIATYKSFGSDLKTCKPGLRSDGYKNPQPAAETGCAPFGNISHIDIFRLWENGDVFLVYPAVYTGTVNNLIITERNNKYQSPVIVPEHITIKGVVINGIRPIILNPTSPGDASSLKAPIYIANSSDILIENIDLGITENIKMTYKAGVYIDGANNLTLKNMRIFGFEQVSGNEYGANGIFSTSNTSGTLTLEQLELFHNGGSAGPAHNIYINGSKDQSFTVKMLNSWSHDAYFGHNFKSRAPNNILLGNYLQGGKPQGGIYKQAENYVVDIPNGGELTLKNNILTKSISGGNSNGALVTYAVEGVSDNRVQNVNIVNNTFVAFSETFDGSHPIWPFYFWKGLVPNTADFKIPAFPLGTQVPTVTVSGNTFIGFCPQEKPMFNYRGDNADIRAFSELLKDYSVSNSQINNNKITNGAPIYNHETQGELIQTRTKLTSFFSRVELAFSWIFPATENDFYNYKQYTYRYYQNTDYYLGISTLDNHVYYMSGLDMVIHDAGDFSDLEKIY